ncbi:CD276 antigen-like [Acipenser oxyrinchus oxyrinchus]|uniref:CD276 antigen-like n=1 Tax=Acipenser oxyrinchus oxyrinchus TaxID=40147 RepID=A0AAD8FTD3_ACIOX|nr:CD276 antigen-like [Acipenser oxyrinchus oxyrinchus]
MPSSSVLGCPALLCCYEEDAQLFCLFALPLLLTISLAVLVPRSPVTSPPGSDVTLSCSFSYKAGADLRRLVVTWERPPADHVVHSFYYGQDQLSLQNETYRNRTQLFPEQLSVGNASLRLKQVRGEDEGWYTCAVTNQVESTQGDVQLIVAGLAFVPGGRSPLTSALEFLGVEEEAGSLVGSEDDQLALQNETYRNRTQLFPEQLSVGNASLRLKQVRGEDEGWYTCAVTNQVESTQGDVQLIVAAPYSEPQLAIGLPRPGDHVTLTVKVAGGYPRPTLLWLNAAGSDITNQSHTKQSVDSRGLYQIQSELEAVVNEAETFTFELDHPVMEQRVSRAVTLHPSTGKGMWSEIRAERWGEGAPLL